MRCAGIGANVQAAKQLCQRARGVRRGLQDGVARRVHAAKMTACSVRQVSGPEHDVKLLRPEHDVKLDPS